MPLNHFFDESQKKRKNRTGDGVRLRSFFFFFFFFFWGGGGGFGLLVALNIAYQNNISTLVIDAHIRLENVKMEGRSEKSSIARPFLPSSNQQALAQPPRQETVTAKGRWFRFYNRSKSPYEWDAKCV